MSGVIVRIIVNAIALWAAARLIDGIELSSSVWSVLFVAAIFGVVNAFVKPVLKVLSFPIVILTLGLFTLVVNAAMLALTAWTTDSLDIDGFWPAMLGAIVVAVVSWVLSIVVPDDD